MNRRWSRERKPLLTAPRRKLLLQKAGAGLDAFRRHLNAPPGFVVIGPGRIVSEHGLLHELSKQHQVVHGVEARGFVAPGEIGIGTAAILRRAGARAANAPRITLAGCGGQAFLNAKLMLPPADHVVDVPELGIPAKPKIRQRDIDRGAAQVRFRVSDAANGKFKQMEAGPPHSHLQNAVQCSQ